MLLDFASSISRSPHRLPILLSSVVALTLCAPVRAEPPAPSVVTTIKPMKGGGYVVVKTETTSIPGIKNVDAAMLQNLKMVPELVKEATFAAKLATNPTSALMAVWHVQRNIGDMSGAKDTLDYALEDVEYKDSYQTPYPYAVIAGAQAKGGDNAGAEATFAVALKIAPTMHDEYSKNRAFCAIAEAQAKAGDTAGAKRTLAIATQQAAAASSLSEIAESQASMGDIAGAKAMADTIQDPTYKSAALSAVAAAQAETGDIGSAKATFTAAKQTADKIEDAGRKNYRFQTIVETQLIAQAKTGDIEGAKKTYAEIPGSTDGKVYHIRYIVEAEVKAGDLTGAQTTVNSMSDDYENKVNVLAVIAAAQAKMGDKADADRNFALAKRIAGRHIFVDGPAYALYALAEAQTQAGYFMDARSTIVEIDNAERKATALASLASAILDAAKKQSDTAKK